VERLVWIRHPSNEQWKGQELSQQLSAEQQGAFDRDLRLAVIDMYTAPVEQGGLIRVANRHVLSGQHGSRNRVYSLCQLEGKLVCFQPADGNEILFVGYSNMSKLR
jgi:hypothetical protein